MSMEKKKRKSRCPFEVEEKKLLFVPFHGPTNPREKGEVFRQGKAGRPITKSELVRRKKKKKKDTILASHGDERQEYPCNH